MHSFAFLATEQLNWSNWGGSAPLPRALQPVAAEGWENITHSFKPGSPNPASLTFRRATIPHLCICRHPVRFNQVTSTSVKKKKKACANRWLNAPQCEIHYILVTVKFVEAARVTAARIEKWAPRSEPNRLHSRSSGAFPNICTCARSIFKIATERLWCIKITEGEGVTLITTLQAPGRWNDSTAAYW